MNAPTNPSSTLASVIESLRLIDAISNNLKVRILCNSSIAKLQEELAKTGHTVSDESPVSSPHFHEDWEVFRVKGSTDLLLKSRVTNVGEYRLKKRGGRHYPTDVLLYTLLADLTAGCSLQTKEISNDGN